MHPSIVRVWQNSDQSYSADPDRNQVFWSKLKAEKEPESHGLTVGLKKKLRGKWCCGLGLTHGMTAWAEREGKPEKLLKMRFDEPSMGFVFPEVFEKLERDRRAAKIAARRAQKVAIDRAWRGRVTVSTNIHTSHDRSDEEVGPGVPFQPLTV